MELDLHQLDLRYEPLRRKNPQAEKRLVGSLSMYGQQTPVVVVSAEGRGVRYVLIDGYKRVRALRRLAVDRVRAAVWEVEESEALLMERMMRSSKEDALEQAWVLAELSERFGLSYEELGKRFDKSSSWVSRRLALAKELPTAVQDQVRSGELSAYTAMKYLVPLARANPDAAVKLASAIGPLKLSTRSVEILYQGFQSGTDKTRELILNSPQVFLRAHHEQQKEKPSRSEAQKLIDDLRGIHALSRRARRALEAGLLPQLRPGDAEQVSAHLAQARGAAESLFNRFTLETEHAR